MKVGRDSAAGDVAVGASAKAGGGSAALSVVGRMEEVEQNQESGDFSCVLGEWRLPSGLCLGEYALAGGFLAPRLWSNALRQGRDDHGGFAVLAPMPKQEI